MHRVSIKQHLQHSMMDLFRCYIMIVSCKERYYDHSPEAILIELKLHKCMGGRGSDPDPTVSLFFP